jgi:hypothetical protein
MHPQSHLIVSWLVGCRLREWRDRFLVAWSGLAPDLDGLTALAGEEAFGRWHHTLTHGLPFAVCVATVAVCFARQRLTVTLLSLAAFHLHLLCDFLGSGLPWGIVYLYPLSDHEYFSPDGWSLVSWQNVGITVLALVSCGHVALRHGRTFVEALLPRRVDRAVVEVIRRRLGTGDDSTTVVPAPPPSAEGSGW